MTEYFAMSLNEQAAERRRVQGLNRQRRRAWGKANGAPMPRGTMVPARKQWRLGR